MNRIAALALVMLTCGLVGTGRAETVPSAAPTAAAPSPDAGSTVGYAASQQLVGRGAIRQPSLIPPTSSGEQLIPPAPPISAIGVAPAQPQGPIQWIQSQISRNISASSEGGGTGGQNGSAIGGLHNALGSDRFSPPTTLSAPFTDLDKTTVTPQNANNINLNQPRTGPAAISGASAPTSESQAAPAIATVNPASSYWAGVAIPSKGPTSLDQSAEPTLAAAENWVPVNVTLEPGAGQPPPPTTIDSYLMPFGRIVWGSVLVIISIAIVVFVMWTARAYREWKAG